jgi:hypothetical protein
MNRFCHGRSFSIVPASRPAVQGSVSTNRMTLSARLSPFASQGWGGKALERARREVGFGVALIPRIPM